MGARSWRNSDARLEARKRVSPTKFAGYGRHCWGITASDGRGPETLKVTGYHHGITG